MKRTTTLTLLLAHALGTLCYASITLEIIGDRLNGFGGSGDPSSVNSLVALVADTDNGGVTAWQGNVSAGGFLDAGSGSSTDLILGLATLGTSTAQAGSYYEVFNNLSFSGNWGSGDNLYLVWFPSYTYSPTVNLVGGDSAPDYGIVSLGATPADGTFWTTLDYLTPDASGLFGTGTDPLTIANLAVQPVPEPSSFFVLAGLGVMGLLRRRVRRPSN